jgi:transposase
MSTKRSRDISDLTVIGVDIGKDVFHLVGFDASGTLALRMKIKRLDLFQLFEKLPRCIVGMEACLSAHFVSRTLRGLGFEPRIIPAIYVKPFNKGQKRRHRINWTCRHCIVCARDWCRGEQARSIRSAPS